MVWIRWRTECARCRQTGLAASLDPPVRRNRRFRRGGRYGCLHIGPYLSGGAHVCQAQPMARRRRPCWPAGWLRLERALADFLISAVSWAAALQRRAGRGGESLSSGADPPAPLPRNRSPRITGNASAIGPAPQQRGGPHDQGALPPCRWVTCARWGRAAFFLCEPTARARCGSRTQAVTAITNPPVPACRSCCRFPAVGAPRVITAH